MKPSVFESKRARPLLGTTLTICLRTDSEDGNPLIDKLFQRAVFLEGLFSLHQHQSELSRWNRGECENTNPLLQALIAESLALEQESGGAFCPHRGKDIDLNGIAKGAIVDFLVEAAEEMGCLGGSVNAGGDLRTFGDFCKNVDLRLGPPDAPLSRNFSPRLRAVASSQVAQSIYSENSSTRYPLPLRANLETNDTVTVNADRAALADALTKVALFGEHEKIEACAKNHNATILIFDDKGEPKEIFGIR